MEMSPPLCTLAGHCSFGRHCHAPATRGYLAVLLTLGVFIIPLKGKIIIVMQRVDFTHALPINHVGIDAPSKHIAWNLLHHSVELRLRCRSASDTYCSFLIGPITCHLPSSCPAAVILQWRLDLTETHAPLTPNERKSWRAQECPFESS